MKTIEEMLKAMNLHRVQQKGDKGLSQEYEKDRTVQHKKRKATLPKIASPAMMDTCETEFSDDSSPMDEEGGVSDRNDDKNKNIMKTKKQNAQTKIPLFRWKKV